MIRTPDLPIREKKEFDSEEFEREKEWLIKKQEGKIQTSTTGGGWVLALGTAALVAFIVGGAIGALLAAIFQEFVYLLTPPITVFVIALYFIKGDFAVVDIDPESQEIFYEGAVSFGGELRSIRYRGTIEIIEGSQLVRLKSFLGKSRFYLRFVTRSGYLRVEYKPDTEMKFLKSFEKVGLLELEFVKAATKQDPIRETETAFIYYETKFDRTEFYTRVKQEKEEEKRKLEVERRIKRQQALNQQSDESDPIDNIEMQEDEYME